MKILGDILLGLLLIVVGVALVAAQWKAVIDIEVEKHLKDQNND